MTIQLAVKLPEEVVARVDQMIARGEFANRSQAIRQALEALLQSAERRRIDAAFAEGFARVPEDDAELRDAMRLAIEAIEDEPWDRWW